jgi:PIN domain nuclease of toxin-antitoxin system
MTRYLLDTHFYLLVDDRRPASRQGGANVDRGGDCTVSVASLWEMLHKNAKGKLPLPEAPIHESLEAQGFRMLPIHARHVEATRQFGHMRDDPFDRLLAATAASEDLVFLTRDEEIQRSGLPFVRTV